MLHDNITLHNLFFYLQYKLELTDGDGILTGEPRAGAGGSSVVADRGMGGGGGGGTGDGSL